MESTASFSVSCILLSNNQLSLHCFYSWVVGGDTSEYRSSIYTCLFALELGNAKYSSLLICCINNPIGCRENLVIISPELILHVSRMLEFLNVVRHLFFLYIYLGSGESDILKHVLKTCNLSWYLGSLGRCRWNSTRYNMHGWVMLGEMTWIRRVHSGLPEHLRTSCGTGRLLLDVTLAGFYFKAVLYNRVLYRVTSEHCQIIGYATHTNYNEIFLQLPKPIDFLLSLWLCR